MAPPAKKSKSVAPAPVGMKGSLQKMFVGQGMTEPQKAAAQPAAAPVVTATAPTVAHDAQAEAQPAAAPVVTAIAPTVARDAQICGTTPVAHVPIATPARAGLSSEQLQRIEENRRLAMERAQAKKRAAEDSTQKPAEEDQKAAPAQAQVQALAAAQAAPADAVSTPPPRSAQPKAGGKAKAKAKVAAGKAAKSEAQNQDTDSTGSPLKPPTTAAAAAAADATPEKTAPPSQDKRPSSAAPKTFVSAAVAALGCGGFDSTQCNEWLQYTGLYSARLAALKAGALEEARGVWGGQVPPSAFQSDISGYRRERETVIAGILFKEMNSRVNVVEQFKKNPLCCTLLSEETVTGKVPEPGSLCADEDRLFAEDSSMRVRLVVAPALLHSVCSGIVAALKGSARDDGDFEVSGVVFGRLAPPPVMKPLGAAALTQGPFIAMVSGLAAPGGVPSEALCRAQDRLVAFLATGAPGPLERLLVCGGSLCAPGDKLTKQGRLATDELCARLAAAAPVQLMPGHADPTNFSLPQMPLHAHFFIKARASGNFRCVSNPFSGTVESSGLRLLGHAGQPVTDVLRCTRGKDALSALKLCFEARHLAPTAPETLAMPPFSGEDPFVIKEVPHVLFSGGHARAEHSWVQAARGTEDRSGTLCVCVPAFYLQPAVVLINTRDPRDVRVHDMSA